MSGLWGPAMFFGALILIFSGYPVAFALGGTALLFALIGSLSGHFDLILLYALPERTFGTMSNYTLLAVPFFIFMGTVLEKSRLAEQLLETIGALFGHFRGGLALGVIFVGALLAAATGYKDSVSLGVIAASGTLGQIIPPSIVLIVLGDQMGVSVGDLFGAALLPGLVLTGLYAVYVVALAFFNKDVAPALPPEARSSGLELLKRVVVSLAPPLILIVVVLGSIFAGVATPTEAGALGAVGAMGLAAVNRWRPNRSGTASSRPGPGQSSRVSDRMRSAATPVPRAIAAITNGSGLRHHSGSAVRSASRSPNSSASGAMPKGAA